MRDDGAFDRQLELGWQALSPPEGSKQRVRARVAAAGGAALPGGGVSVASGASRWQALRASGGLGAGAGLVLLGLGIAAGYWLRASSEAPLEHAGNETDAAVLATRSAPAPAPAALPAPLPAPSVPAPGAALAEPPPVASSAGAVHGSNAERAPQRAAPSRARPAPRAASPARDGQELLLIERAERAVRAHHPDLALALSAELDATYPRSSLLEERGAIRLMASCQAGLPASGALRERFGRQYPGSVYGERITAECDTAGDTAPLR